MIMARVRSCMKGKFCGKPGEQVMRESSSETSAQDASFLQRYISFIIRVYLFCTIQYPATECVLAQLEFEKCKLEQGLKRSEDGHETMKGTTDKEDGMMEITISTIKKLWKWLSGKEEYQGNLQRRVSKEDEVSGFADHIGRKDNGELLGAQKLNKNENISEHDEVMEQLDFEGDKNSHERCIKTIQENKRLQDQKESKYEKEVVNKKDDVTQIFQSNLSLSVVYAGLTDKVEEQSNKDEHFK
ncbi:hypothetical protein KI387_021304 [Taxus chinensis]|uniref:Uncharacterized protein n=1 Tax=Taxus chinensis TaxID=29808 RepID=A0AA38LF34_TAXCH|nr:hypothetical protein KI387_021304 [Taxus chinensis]